MLRPFPILLLAMVLPLASCTKPVEELPRVQGQVLLHGVPLNGGTIVFSPDAERGGSGALAYGVIGPDGRYTLTTEGRPGAVAGWHRVSIAGVASSSNGPLLPERYHNPEQSGLSCEVKTGIVNTIDQRLE